MRWSRFTTRRWAIGVVCCLMPALATAQQDSVDSLGPKPAESACVLPLADTVTSVDSKYDQRMHRYRKHWNALIPRQFVVQNAGNMGLVSLGFGWDYGRRRQWETDVLLGYIPEHQSSRGKLTMTLKENFLPWSITLKRGWSVEPLQASIYLNTVYGHEFWKTQPGRYPDSYYDFMSTKFRLNIAIGQRVSWQIPQKHRRFHRSISLFYEVGSCDLYIRSKFIDGSVPLKDILGLSIGLKLQTL